MILKDLKIKSDKSKRLYCDNKFDINIENDVISTPYVSSQSNMTDLLTKRLATNNLFTS